MDKALCGLAFNAARTLRQRTLNVHPSRVVATARDIVRMNAPKHGLTVVVIEAALFGAFVVRMKTIVVLESVSVDRAGPTL
jgi:hypothetical protein